MSDDVSIREITTGRIATLRLAPNEDIVEGLERAASRSGFAWSLVRGAVGSLVDATLETPLGEELIFGPGVEMLSLSGELRASGADDAPTILHAVVGATDGTVRAGRLVRGRNLVCATLEVNLEEIVASPALSTIEERSSSTHLER